MSGLQPLGSSGARDLGLRPRLVWVGPSALVVERLMHFVTALGQDVVIEIRPRGAGVTLHSIPGIGLLCFQSVSGI